MYVPSATGPARLSPPQRALWPPAGSCASATSVSTVEPSPASDVEPHRGRLRERVGDREAVVGAVAVGRDDRRRERERRRRGRGGQHAERREHRAGARSRRVAGLDAVGEWRARRDRRPVRALAVPRPGDVGTGAARARRPAHRARRARSRSSQCHRARARGTRSGRALRCRSCRARRRRAWRRRSWECPSPAPRLRSRRAAGVDGLPGQSVALASRCPLTTRSDTRLPAAKRLLPPETIVACPSGSTCATSSRHAIRLASASRAASVSGASEPFPITAMPTLPV